MTKFLRVLLFVGLGPPLGFVLEVLMSGQTLRVDPEHLFAFGLLLAIAYGIGLVPALFAGIVDSAMENSPSLIARAAASAVAGAFALFVVTLLIAGPRGADYIPGRAFAAAALAAVLCSLIASRIRYTPPE
jgi:hypothetical protein